MPRPECSLCEESELEEPFRSALLSESPTFVPGMVTPGQTECHSACRDFSCSTCEMSLNISFAGCVHPARNFSTHISCQTVSRLVQGLQKAEARLKATSREMNRQDLLGSTAPRRRFPSSWSGSAGESNLDGAACAGIGTTVEQNITYLSSWLLESWCAFQKCHFCTSRPKMVQENHTEHVVPWLSYEQTFFKGCFSA